MENNLVAEQNIAIVIQEAGKNPRVSIHPERSLPSFQRIYGNQLIDFYLVDENGERVKGTAKPTQSREEKAFEALKKEAQELGIKGFQNMKEETLLKKVQEASNKK